MTVIYHSKLDTYLHLHISLGTPKKIKSLHENVSPFLLGGAILPHTLPQRLFEIAKIGRAMQRFGSDKGYRRIELSILEEYSAFCRRFGAIFALSLVLS